MIDEQKLLDWLTKRIRQADPRDQQRAERVAYRRLLSKIENGEFEQANVVRQPSWMDDDDRW